MSLRVVAVDMDGTFLRPDMTYDRPRFARLLARLGERGVRFVVASGNQSWQLRSFFEPTDAVAFAAENGHFVYDTGRETPLFAVEPDPALGRALVGTLEDLRHPYLVSSVEGAFMPTWVRDADEAWARLYYPRLTMLDAVGEIAETVVKASLRVDDPVAVAEQLSRALGHGVAAAASGPEDVDVNAPGHHKATGLARLLDHWGVDWADVVAFGDNHNDLEMLDAAGLAVAMANARSEVKDAADRVAPANAADGVLEVLDELFPAHDRAR